ncbi:MAG: exodeoxyribonuclease III [Candidatus Falkowbacteria bacterium]|nr:exodeoxyribonuclease III [Candidatus Falkowbacteria bacterium]
MKLISWNVNGIRACVRNGFTDFLHSYKPDIMGLQEIKIDDVSRAAHDFDFRDYKEVWNPAKKPGYSGTATLSKEAPLSYKAGIGIEKFDNEGRIQTTEFKKFYFINAYFPNAQPELVRLDYKEAFNEAILKHVKKLEKKKPVIITGDFNVAMEEIDLARPKENIGSPGFSNEERYWGREFLKAGLVDTFRSLQPDTKQYSWWSYRAMARERNVGWRIDYFLVSAKIMGNVKQAFILDKVKGSDHCPVGIEINW